MTLDKATKSLYAESLEVLRREFDSPLLHLPKKRRAKRFAFLLVFLVFFDMSLSPSSNTLVLDYSEDIRVIREILKWKEINNSIWIESKVPVKYQYFFQDWNYSYSPVWLAKIIQVESGWREWVIGPENSDGSQDFGMAQLNSTYHSYFEENRWNLEEDLDILNGHHALLVAAEQLEYLYSILLNEKEMIKAYNIGIGSVLYGWRIKAGERYLKKVQSVW